MKLPEYWWSRRRQQEQLEKVQTKNLKPNLRHWLDNLDSLKVPVISYYNDWCLGKWKKAQRGGEQHQ